MNTWEKIFGAFMLTLLVVLIALGLWVIKQAVGFEVSSDSFILSIAVCALFIGFYNLVDNNTSKEDGL